jgi:hypothetical protein
VLLIKVQGDIPALNSMGVYKPAPDELLSWSWWQYMVVLVQELESFETIIPSPGVSEDRHEVLPTTQNSLSVTLMYGILHLQVKGTNAQ